MNYEEEAIKLAKAVLLLEKYRFIQTCHDASEDEEMQCEHLRRIALHHARNIQHLANKAE